MKPPPPATSAVFLPAVFSPIPFSPIPFSPMENSPSEVGSFSYRQMLGSTSVAPSHFLRNQLRCKQDRKARVAEQVAAPQALGLGHESEEPLQPRSLHPRG